MLILLNYVYVRVQGVKDFQREKMKGRQHLDNHFDNEFTIKDGLAKTGKRKKQLAFIFTDY